MTTPNLGQLRRARETASVPQPLYVKRVVTNGKDIARWAKGAGLPPVDANDLHVTIVYSKMPVDWMRLGEVYRGYAGNGGMVLPEGGPRMLDLFGPEGAEDTVVLCFASADLKSQWRGLIAGGCSSDRPDFQPHISLFKLEPGTAVFTAEDLRQIPAYTGEIKLGPEIYQPLKVKPGTPVVPWQQAMADELLERGFNTYAEYLEAQQKLAYGYAGLAISGGVAGEVVKRAD